MKKTEYRIDKNQSNIDVVNNDSNERNSSVVPGHINNTLITGDVAIETVENPVIETFLPIKPINEWIKEIFIQNLTAINSLNFNERNYN